MSESAIRLGAGRGMLVWLPRLAALLVAAALVLVALVPFGWRFGLWHFRTSFAMAAWAQDLAVAAGVVAAIGLVLARASLSRRATIVAAAIVLLGALWAYVPWQFARIRGPLPPINDITTDAENPPEFAASLPAREAEHGVSTVYGGAAIAAQQKAAYPDIAPAILALPPDQAFARALAAVKSLGWRIAASDEKSGLIEASDTTLYFGFTDDIVIRIAADGAGSRIDIRSHSRQGRGDFGVNAARIRKYLSALKAG
jgi:uncharacterized protein (DUF1499 family)